MMLSPFCYILYLLLFSSSVVLLVVEMLDWFRSIRYSTVKNRYRI